MTKAYGLVYALERLDTFAQIDAIPAFTEEKASPNWDQVVARGLAKQVVQEVCSDRSAGPSQLY